MKQSDVQSGGSDQTAASGVEALIERLRDEGVAKGREESTRIVARAEEEAAEILGRARKEAKAMVAEAHKEAARLKTSGEEALRVAMRDAVLRMKETMLQRFDAQMERLISKELKDESFLRRLILELAGRAREETGVDEAKRVEMLLPEDIVGLEEMRRNPDEYRKGALSQFVLGVTGDMLREGVEFAPSDEHDAGVRVRIVDQDVRVDLSDRAIAELLLQHLQPRFRAILDGVVR